MTILSTLNVTHNNTHIFKKQTNKRIEGGKTKPEIIT